MSNIKPYKTGTLVGIPTVLQLLRPDVKKLIDLMYKTKGCYIGVSDGDARLYIDDQPIIKVASKSLEDIISVLDDVKEYADITEYRLTETRMKQILIYYI